MPAKMHSRDSYYQEDGNTGLTDVAETPLGWHVLWTRSNSEQLVRDQLVAKDYEVFLPMINQWFSGGEGRTFRVDLQVPEDSFDIGSRLLVSGESRWGEANLADAIAWGCGFTRYHAAKTAREWQRAF